MHKKEVSKVVRRKGRANRVPLGPNWFAYETLIRHKQALEELIYKYPTDLIFIVGRCAGPFTNELQGRICEDGSIVDDMGVVWKHSPRGVGPVRVASPLDNWENLDSYIRDYLDNYSLQSLGETREVVKENPDTFVIYGIGMGLFEQLRGLRGTTGVLIDLYLHRKEINKLKEALLSVYIQLVRNAAQGGADGVWIGDDFGTQKQLFMNPVTWREVFRPWYREVVEEIHKLGMLAFLHSCGNVREIVPDIIEAGFDSLHPIQPGPMDQKKIVKEFGRDITFCTGGDVQGVLPLGTPEQVKEHIKRVFEIFDRSQGGFIFMSTNTIMPETPLENIETMLETARNLGESSIPLSML